MAPISAIRNAESALGHPVMASEARPSQSTCAARPLAYHLSPVTYYFPKVPDPFNSQRKNDRRNVSVLQEGSGASATDEAKACGTGSKPLRLGRRGLEASSRQIRMSPFLPPLFLPQSSIANHQSSIQRPSPKMCRTPLILCIDNLPSVFPEHCLIESVLVNSKT
jgi:hypothetical protein